MVSVLRGCAFRIDATALAALRRASPVNKTEKSSRKKLDREARRGIIRSVMEKRRPYAIGAGQLNNKFGGLGPEATDGLSTNTHGFQRVFTCEYVHAGRHQTARHQATCGHALAAAMISTLKMASAACCILEARFGGIRSRNGSCSTCGPLIFDSHLGVIFPFSTICIPNERAAEQFAAAPDRRRPSVSAVSCLTGGPGRCALALGGG